MSPQALHSVTTDRSSPGSVSMKDLTHAANFAFVQQEGSSSDQGISSPKSPLSFDNIDNCEDSQFKKRKFSVSTMVDDIFAGTDESCFLQNPPTKMRRCMSRSKSYRSLPGGTVTGGKTRHLEHGTSSTESMVSENQAEHTNRSEGYVSAINIYNKLFLPEIQTHSSSFSSKASGKDSRGLLTSRSNSISSLKIENNNENTYGWFVQTDDEHDQEVARSYSTTSTVFDDLAFKAPTAPKRVNDNAEVEWARAADTVDDVLRDLF